MIFRRKRGHHPNLTSETHTSRRRSEKITSRGHFLEVNTLRTSEKQRIIYCGWHKILTDIRNEKTRKRENEDKTIKKKISNTYKQATSSEF